MKKYIYIVLAMMLLAACSSPDNSVQRSAIGTVKAGDIIYLDENKINIHVPEGMPAGYTAGDRVTVYFHILAEMSLENIYAFEVKIDNISKIPVQSVEIISNDAADTLYKAPFTKIERMWISENNYLTVDYYYTTTGDTLHLFDLADKLSNNTTAVDTLYINFRHNAQGDTIGGSSTRSLLSFKLDELKPLMKKDSVTLTVKSNIIQNSKVSTNTRHFKLYK